MRIAMESVYSLQTDIGTKSVPGVKVSSRLGLAVFYITLVYITLVIVQLSVKITGLCH